MSRSGSEPRTDFAAADSFRDGDSNFELRARTTPSGLVVDAPRGGLNLSRRARDQVQEEFGAFLHEDRSARQQRPDSIATAAPQYGYDHDPLCRITVRRVGRYGADL